MDAFPIYSRPSYDVLYNSLAAFYKTANASNTATAAETKSTGDSYTPSSAVDANTKAVAGDSVQKPKSLEDQIKDYYSMVKQVNSAGAPVSKPTTVADTAKATSGATSDNAAVPADKAADTKSTAVSAKTTDDKPISLEDQIKNYYTMVDNINASAISKSNTPLDVYI